MITSVPGREMSFAEKILPSSLAHECYPDQKGPVASGEGENFLILRRCKVSSEIWFSRFVTMMPCSPTIVTECKPGFEARRHPVEKGTEFQRGGLARGVKNMNWQRLWFEGLKNQLQSSRTLRCVHLVRHDARQSSAGNSSDDGGLRRVHTQPRPNRHKAFPLTCSEFPGVRRRERIDRYAIVIANFLGCLRMPSRRQIGGACTHHEADRPDPGRYHIALRESADPDLIHQCSLRPNRRHGQ